MTSGGGTLSLVFLSLLSSPARPSTGLLCWPLVVTLSEIIINNNDISEYLICCHVGIIMLV